MLHRLLRAPPLESIVSLASFPNNYISFMRSFIHTTRYFNLLQCTPSNASSQKAGVREIPDILSATP